MPASTVPACLIPRPVSRYPNNPGTGSIYFRHHILQRLRQIAGRDNPCPFCCERDHPELADCSSTARNRCDLTFQFLVAFSLPLAATLQSDYRASHVSLIQAAPPSLPDWQSTLVLLMLLGTRLNSSPT